MPRIAHEASVLAALCEQGGPVQRIVTTTSGRAYAENDRRIMMVTEYVKGKPAPETPEGFAAVGASLASLHTAMDSRLNFVDSLPELDPLVILLNSGKAVEERIGPVAGSAIKARIKVLYDRLHEAAKDGYSNAPGHGDAHGYNLMLTQDSNTVWIDLEDAFAGPRVYDLATVVWSSFRHSETQPLWSAALEAYAQVRSVTNEFKHIELFVALRHLWWLALHARHWGEFHMHQERPGVFPQRS